MATRVAVVVEGELVWLAVKKWQITFFDCTAKVIESDMSLTELYAKYENAATIEEL